MSIIEIVVPATTARFWQYLVVERLRAAGHDIAVTHGPDREWPAAMSVAMRLERRLFRRAGPGLMDITPTAEAPAAGKAALRLDLSGAATANGTPTLRLAFDGSFSSGAVLRATAAGKLPEIDALLDGRPVARAAPMIDRRESAVLGAEDVFARAVTLAVSLAGRIVSGTEVKAPETPEWSSPEDGGSSAAFLRAYGFSSLPRLGAEALRRVRYRHAHWRVGYRFVDGPGVAGTGRLGHGWRQVPDDGSHFYADPFPFEWRGRHFIFVEDYPHGTGKALISVTEVDEEGTPATPTPVLEEPFHLSYPQIFEHSGDLWMLPEASASGRLTLYRAERFPDGWMADTVLLDGGTVSDATLLQCDGRFWLFATDRDGHGSTSDTLVIFHAPALKGPWTAHSANPVLIDRRKARPGGAFVRVGKRLLLPIQDGTLGYGGGLGFAELLELDENSVRLSDPVPLDPDGDWPYRQVHTLNRAGRLEVIDGIATVRKRG